MHEKHDQGVQGSSGKLSDLLVCTIITKGQKDYPICKTESGQEKCSIGYGSIYW